MRSVTPRLADSSHMAAAERMMSRGEIIDSTQQGWNIEDNDPLPGAAPAAAFHTSRSSPGELPG
ncbi:MAG: hypothetical protein ABI283_00980 [Rhodanobacter sp.]